MFLLSLGFIHNLNLTICKYHPCKIAISRISYRTSYADIYILYIVLQIILYLGKISPWKFYVFKIYLCTKIFIISNKNYSLAIQNYIIWILSLVGRVSPGKHLLDNLFPKPKTTQFPLFILSQVGTARKSYNLSFRNGNFHWLKRHFYLSPTSIVKHIVVKFSYKYWYFVTN